MQYRSFRKSGKESRKFRDIFWTVRKLDQIKEGSRDLTQGYLVKIFDAGYEELKNIREENSGSLVDKERRLMSVSRALASAQIREGERQEAFLSFLATTGNSAPFIGLFGTVWGIMDSFRNIGLAGSASLAVVAPGISEALIATAAGLFTAIPAVMAYNYFANRVRVMAGDMEAFSSEFLSIIETLFLSK
jgi:biopolymer transport protein TolQ